MMKKQDKKLFDFHRQNIFERFENYKRSETAYCFSISLAYGNMRPETHVIQRGTSPEIFISKMNEAFELANSFGADSIIVREYDNPDRANLVERTEYRTDIPLKSQGNAPQRAPRSRNQQLVGGLGLADVQSLIKQQSNANTGISIEKHELELEKQKMTFEKDMLAKDRQINELVEQVKQKDEEISSLESELEEKNKSDFLTREGLGSIGATVLQKLVTLNAKPIAGFLGIPEEMLKGTVSPGSPDEGAAQPANTSANERQRYYDEVLTWFSQITDAEFVNVYGILTAMSRDASKIKLVFDLLQENAATAM